MADSAARIATVDALSFAIDGVAGERLPAVLEPGRLVDQEPGGLELGDHVDQEELDRLEVRDRAAELTSLLRVLHRGVERGLGDAERHGPDRDPAAVEGHHELLEAATLRAEHVFLGKLQVVEDQLHRIAAAMPQLLFRRPHGEARRPLLHDEGVIPFTPIPGVVTAVTNRRAADRPFVM